MATVTYQVPNITCGNCVNTIQMKLRGLTGVSNVRATAATKEVVVEFEPPASEDQIEALLTEIHYPAAM
jgi:copper chaperone CopZ